MLLFYRNFMRNDVIEHKTSKMMIVNCQIFNLQIAVRKTQVGHTGRTQLIIHI